MPRPNPRMAGSLRVVDGPNMAGPEGDVAASASRVVKNSRPRSPRPSEPNGFHFQEWLGCASLCILMAGATESILATKDPNNVPCLGQEKSAHILWYLIAWQQTRVTQTVATI